uniref:N-acetyltransferase domain-containing protein n=1 Tax=Tanacetum cinerariifolium TaxID=118510 RepID=A0A699GGM0_TANCI|nr:hypothetical protein [Tanacetum cinerariifolium]
MVDADAEALFAIYGDPLVMKYTDEEPFPTLSTVGIMLKSVRALLVAGQSLEWAIILRGSGDVIGTCGLHSFDLTNGVAEVGCLLKRAEWGKGFMADALALLTRFAADVLKLKRLIADVAPQNQQAQRLFHKLGYRRAASIDAAIQSVEVMVDERLGEYMDNPIIGPLARQMKEKYRGAIIERAATARMEGEVNGE